MHSLSECTNEPEGQVIYENWAPKFSGDHCLRPSTDVERQMRVTYSKSLLSLASQVILAINTQQISFPALFREIILLTSRSSKSTSH